MGLNEQMVISTPALSINDWPKFWAMRETKRILPKVTEKFILTLKENIKKPVLLSPRRYEQGRK